VFDIDLLLAFVFMSLLFLRQISILKQPNKINYIPLIVGIGIISAILHFIIQPEDANMPLVLKESFIPILVSLLLYIVMNVLHQTMQTEQSRMEQEFIRELGQQIEELKESGSELERKILLNQNQDYHTQEEGRERFRHDIKILDAILANQNKFLEKFEQLEGLHIDIAKSFEKFTKVQLPSLDSVVHKHIDILRVTEQDHFNKVKSILEKSVDNKVSMADEIEELKGNLQTISNISQTIAKTIVRYTLEQLGEVVKPFEREILSLKSHAEGVNTSLYESENRLATIKEQSELLMKQMILSSKKMGELQSQNSALYDIYSTMKDLMKDIEIIKSEYVKSQSQLSMIIKDFKDAKDDEIDSIKEQMESLIVILTTKVDRSLERLHEHYHIANEDISQSVKFLSKQAQLKNSYAELDS
jgi:hypothetical protein